MISFVVYCRNLISFSLHFSMGCYFPFFFFSLDLGFFAKHLWAYNWIFQVSRELEQFRRKYFFHKFGSYSLFSPISHCSLSLLFFWCCLLTGCTCDKIDFSCVYFIVCLCGLCLVWYFSFLWLCVRRILFLFRCTLPCDATFLFWPFHRILVSLPTINMCT